MLITRPDWKKIFELSFKKSSNNNLFNKFTLNDIGCDIKRLPNFLATYDNLPIDNIKNENKFPPTRFRRYLNIDILIKDYNRFEIVHNNNYKFKQDADDFRNKERIFKPILYKGIDYEFINIITQLSGLTIYAHNIKRNTLKTKRQNKIKKINMSIHQVRLLSYPGYKSDNSPENIHKDGVDYIVSALVLNKKNIKGGKSVIYNENKQEMYNTYLNENEFIFQNDKDLWHDITKIESDGNYVGYRDILGFDIKIL